MFFDEEGVKVFIYDKLLKQVFDQEFVSCLTCQPVGKILLENQLIARLKIWQLTV